MALGDDLEVVEDVKLHEDVDVAGLRGGNIRVVPTALDFFVFFYLFFLSHFF